MATLDQLTQAKLQPILDSLNLASIATPSALAALLKDACEGTMAKGDDFVIAADLPALAIDGGALDEDSMNGVLRALAKSTLDAAHPAVMWLREHATLASREQFAWQLFQEWRSASTPSKQKWAMIAMGWLGDEVCARKLAPLIRVWPGESQHQRAVLGLQVLRRIGNEAALMQLSSIAAKLKFKGLKAKANEAMEAIAEERGLTRNELDDLVIPDCGLNDRGCVALNFGPRTFTIKIGTDFKPTVLDENGKKRASLPKAAKSDDQDLAAEAHRFFKEMKKQIKEVVQIQTTRLELAMVGGRRWTPANFTRTFITNPLCGK